MCAKCRKEGGLFLPSSAPLRKKKTPVPPPSKLAKTPSLAVSPWLPLVAVLVAVVLSRVWGTRTSAK